MTFAVVLLLSFAVGASTQAVLGGRPYLAGSTEAETFEMTEQVKADLETLRGQTTLLSVTPEQARTLHKQLDEAAAQALEIAERLNPATKESLPVPGLFEAYQRASYAATIEAEALEAQKANSVTPEPSLSAMIEQARKELDVLLGTGEGSVEQAMGLALEQAVGDAP